MTELPAAWLVPPQPVRRARVSSADGTRLNVEVHGPQAPGTPTVVLIHGWTCSIPFWAPVIRALRDDLRVVAYDQRGHGGSHSGRRQRGRARYSTGVLADDLEAVLDETVATGETAVLAGHSMGGMTIMAAAGRESVLSRAGGVLLASTGAADLVSQARTVPLGTAVPRVAAAAQRRLLTSAAPFGPVSRLSRALLGYLTLGPAASAPVRAANAAIIHACDRRARAAWGRVLAGLDVTAGAGRLDRPAQVLVGTADRLTPPAHARRLAGLLPRCEGLTELPGVGHMTPLEAPGTVAELIRKLAAGSEAAR
jgi:pimeloyl-ACP methyl ester carboxylesterase